MAVKNQGIMSVAPGLVNEIVGADKRKGLGELIGDNTQAYTDDEFYGGNANNLFSLGAKGTYTDELLRNVFRPGKVVSDVVANVPGVFSGLGEYMRQKGDNERQQDAQKIASNMAGEVFGLPTNQTNLGKPDLQGNPIVPKGLYDAFDTLDGGQGQERLVDTQFPEGLTIQDKINEQIANNKSTADGIVNTSFDSDFDADLAGSTGATDGSVEGADTNAKKATVGALSEFLAQARPGIKPQTYGEYIKEFGDVTGLDVSGDPDNKVALMSFGLALMQNRAGKDFNVSKILSAVGEAGEAAMPDFRRALVKAETVRAKAGEYALGKTEKDKAAAMNRKNYYIVPKGTGGIKGIIDNFDKGQFQPLNSYELNSLQENSKFNDQYDIVPSSVYAEYTKSLLKSPELQDLGKKYSTKIGNMQLFEGSKGTVFDIPVQYPDGNYQGSDGAKKPIFAGDYDNVMNGFKRMRRDIDKGKAEFKKLMGAIAAPGGTTVWKQGFDNLTNLAAAFGVPVSKNQTSTKTIDLILNRIQAKYAPEILGEAGKTISDGDRARVAQIVGDLKFFQNPADLEAAISMIFSDIIGGQENKLNDGLRSFNSLTNKKVAFESGGNLNKEQLLKLQEYEKKFNIGKKP